MPNVPATKTPNLAAARALKNNAHLSNIAAKIMSGTHPGENVKVPTDNRQPKARANALKAISPKGGSL